MDNAFTSYYDDEHGGDTDGTSVTPGPGDWDYITVENVNGTIFNYCEFYYSGGSYSLSDYTLHISQANVTVTNCIFAHNQGQNQGTLNAENANADTIIQNNLFYDNEKPLSVNASYNLDASNTFTYQGQGNELNGIFLKGNVPNNSTIIWSENEVPYVFSELTVPSTSSLQLNSRIFFARHSH